MDTTIIQAISKQIYRQFPEFAGIRPVVRLSPQTATPRQGERTYVLTYKMNARLSTGKTLARSVRVTAQPDGHILRVSTTK